MLIGDVWPVYDLPIKFADPFKSVAEYDMQMNGTATFSVSAPITDFILIINAFISPIFDYSEMSVLCRLC